MRLTNLLLLLLILVIGCQKIPILTQEKTVSKKSTVKTSEGIVFGKSTMLETKEIKAISTKKDENKHSTTFRQYIDSDSRSNQSISHNIRIGKGIVEPCHITGLRTHATSPSGLRCGRVFGEPSLHAES